MGQLPEEWPIGFLKDSVATLEILGKTAVRSEDRDHANRLLVRFVQQLGLNEGKSITEHEHNAASSFCSLKVEGSPLVFIWQVTHIDPGFYSTEGHIRAALADVVRGLPQSTFFNILWGGKLSKNASSELFENPRAATATAKQEAIASLQEKRFPGNDQRPIAALIERSVRDLGPEACVVIVAVGGNVDVPASAIQFAAHKKGSPRFFAVATTPTKSLTALIAATGGSGVQIKGRAFSRDVEFVP